MDEPWCPSRRRLLASQCGLLALAVGAGCTESGGERPANRTTSDAGGSTDGTAPGTDTGGFATDALDRREANVVGVTFEGGNGTYTFDVTLHHDDDGEAGYANWWQVERPDGTRLGRRELLHAHAQQPFTRSGTVEVPDGTACVVVRGHDRTHGYGGRALAVNLESGEQRRLDQGPERRPFDAVDCP